MTACLNTLRPCLALILLHLAAVTGFASNGLARADRAPALLFFDGPLWDISDKGLPYRLTVAWPVAPDPLAPAARRRTAPRTRGGAELRRAEHALAFYLFDDDDKG